MSGSNTIRVPIKGQFSTDNVFSAFNKQEVQVDRLALTNTSMNTSPSNWNAFCDKADEALRSLTATKKFYRVFGTITLGGMIILVIGLNVFARKFWRVAHFAPLLFLPVILGYLFVWCKVRGSVMNSMKEVGRICAEMSGNGVTYSLLDEWWGGCNKPHVRRYSINVSTDTTADAENPQPSVSVTNPAEESFTVNPVPVAEPVYTSSPYSIDNQQASTSNTNTSNTGNGGSTSLFDQLKV